jgi:hypothetical protein
MERCITAMVAAGLLGMGAGWSASLPDTGTATAQMVITVRPPQTLDAADLKIIVNKNPARVVRVERLAGDRAGMQLFILLDDSTRSGSLAIQLSELKQYVASLPATAQVAIGYMRNGSFELAQAFTADHSKAATALRLPMALPGENGSPYFALDDLVKHWPSKEASDRRVVLMLTDGVDRYWGSANPDDPYLDTAVNDTLKNGIEVYSIYLRGAGRYGQTGWQRTIAQGHLIEVGEKTGGTAYFEGLSDPVTISPFLKDFESRLENQYKVSIEARAKGVEPVKVATEIPGVKIDAPTRVYSR